MIACDQHDFIEIACLYHFEVVLQLKTGDEITGIAQDTTLNSEREECISLLKNKMIELVALSSIATMRAVAQNRHFDCVIFD